jgi:PadR family transcriptional regulator AphA
MRTPTATSYAMLGLLAMRPWTTYELAKQMGRSLHHVLPRAESNVYAEAKRLEADGLVSAERSKTGKRARTTYSITTAGRDALAAWLLTPARPTTVESEPIVKLLFAQALPPNVLLDHIEDVRLAALAAEGPWMAIADEYLDDRGPFPERLHVNTLYWAFQARWTQLQRDWAAWARDWVATWPGPEGPPPEEVKAVMRAELEALRGGSGGTEATSRDPG